MSSLSPRYDVAVIGGGHNGLVSACYLAKAGLSVLVLERNAELGGATRSAKAFEGMDARLSVYSYLVSLFPQKILDDLGLNLNLLPRRTASYSPVLEDGKLRELLLRNDASDGNREAFIARTCSDSDYSGYLALQDIRIHLASVICPSLT
ncbi:MAG: FAD-dependent oxidoreductase [Verrucomicrobia bacterium]|nr:FAD-dependent oxidoreductase [Verrucomicrobiota bacterium]